MRSLSPLLRLTAVLYCALPMACSEHSAESEHEASVVVVKAVPAPDAGAPSADVPVRMLSPLAPREPTTTSGKAGEGNKAPPHAWVHVRTLPSPEGKPLDPLRTTSARYVDVRQCPDEARRAIAKLKLPKARVNLCEVRIYKKSGEERRVALLLYGKPRECDEGCIYQRKTVTVKGRQISPLDDVFFLPLPEGKEALRAALPSAGVHLRLDAVTDERVLCAPLAAVWLTEGSERRWGWEARYQDATCRVLSQLEERGGTTTGLLYELSAHGTATKANAEGEEWLPRIKLTPLARRVVRFPKGARASLAGAPALEVLDEKLY